MPGEARLYLGDGQHRLQGLCVLRERTPAWESDLSGRVAVQWSVLRLSRKGSLRLQYPVF